MRDGKLYEATKLEIMKCRNTMWEPRHADIMGLIILRETEQKLLQGLIDIEDTGAGINDPLADYDDLNFYLTDKALMED